MSPEAQRIAIAEACGWKAIRMSRRWELSDDPSCPEDWCGRHPVADYWSHLPDYLNNLNAINEAVTSLADPQRTIFMNVLAEIVGWHGNDISLEGYAAHTPELFLFCNATAAQRSEAFLRATGKWTE